MGRAWRFVASPRDRALDELIRLTRKHPGCPVTIVDNILDMKYFQTFIPELGARKMDLQIAYEVKANLKKDQVRLLRQAGICAIQPGIESLSTPILTQMKKGCTSLQNVQLLKWCKEYGVHAVWNILWGFPEESPEEYERMASLAPRISHLKAPQLAASLRLDRFSPYFDHAAEYGVLNVRPYPSYFCVYHLEPRAISNLAYYFTFEYTGPQEPATYTRGLCDAVQAWREERDKSDLFMVDLGSDVLVWDLRSCARDPLHVLSGLARELYLACDAIQGIPSLQRIASRQEPVSRGRIEEVLDPLVESRLMLREGHSFLALAIMLGEYRPAKTIRHRFTALVRRLGSQRGSYWEVYGPKACGRDRRAEPHSGAPALAIGPEHFSLGEAGEILVDLDALERIDLNSLQSQLSRP